MWRALAGSAVVMSVLGTLLRAQDASRGTAALMRIAEVREALKLARTSEPATIADQIRFCEIPAPPFKEAPRGEALKRSFQQLGLLDVRTDEVGNVLGTRPGRSPKPHLVVAAHLDTVFPGGTDVKIKRAGSRLQGPGIGDNCRGLAVLVAIVRTMRQSGVQTSGSITFVADVGEEGLGDLRGVRRLFDVTLKGRVDRFVSIDGTGLSVTDQFVGSRRYRVTFNGPGGHSFGAFGLANPVGALGRAVAKLSEFQVQSDQRTTFAVGRIGGGTSVNAIPSEAWMEVDMRSLDQASLRALDASFQKAVDLAVVEENARWGTPGTVTVARELIGDRPAGRTPAGSAIVETAVDVTRALGLTPVFAVGSSDANYPHSLGIPSIDIGGGGHGTDAHSLREAFDATDSWKGTARALLLAIALAQQ